ncbi:SWIM zinc finger family protein [Paenibacillus dauci]|uniref:SWIM zinc finger family protein n=1 Tax=Paenibacillus dauci TaxID=1567106 RepID=UPI0006191A4C|nr:SWIM zinc finger family protein [Paenibacillus dauci]
MGLELTEAYIDGMAPNAAAIKNARGLIQKRKLVQLNRTADDTLLFGECAGSGKSNYVCSADFIQPDKPVTRCSCPSRQFPCKHALAIMYAYAAGESFAVAEVPEDIVSKREKIEKKEEKQTQTAAQEQDPVKAAKKKATSKNALKKKVQAQLDGLDALEKLLLTLIRDGLGTIDAKTVKMINEQVKQMGNYYLTGAQNELRRLALLLAEKNNREQHYTYIIAQMTRLHALIQKGRRHLQAKLDDPELALDAESTIEEWLGHAWQLSELQEYGKMTEQAELIQLSFISYDDPGRQEYIDLGYWMEMGTSHIYRTLQYRPYRAAKHLREEDSFMEIAAVPSLYRYPGDLNPRVRWDGMTTRAIKPEDIQKVREQAQHSYADIVKQVKNQLKNPLADEHPAMLIHAAEICGISSGGYAITDGNGQHLVLGSVGGMYPDTVQLLSFLPADQLRDVAVLGIFEHRMDTGELVLQPLSIVTNDTIVRLLY